MTMKLFVILFSVFPALLAVASHQQLQTDYIDLSLELTALIKGRTDVTEDEIHALARQVIVEVDNAKKKKLVMEKFAKDKGPEFEKFFHDSYLTPKQEEHVTKRLQSVLGYYLTKQHILQFRNVVLSRMHDGTSRDNIIETIKEELSKDIGEKKANRAVDLTMKDLKILYKMYSELVTKLDEPISYLLRDEL